MKAVLSNEYEVEWYPGSREFVLRTWEDEIILSRGETAKLLQFLDGIRSEILPLQQVFTSEEF